MKYPSFVKYYLLLKVHKMNELIKVLKKDDMFYDYAVAISSHKQVDVCEFVNMFADRKAVVKYLLQCNLQDKVNRYIKQQFRKLLED